MTRRIATWETWDDPDNQAVIVHWRERDIIVVFPIQWAKLHGDKACVERAKERILEVEGKAGLFGVMNTKRCLAPGSTLNAWSRHEEQPRTQKLAPEVPVKLVL